ncbi:MAG TPA: hypothetical protein VJ739_01385 [Gemmataceae bacterium]|nr:hypothetical protein [Gemmataceae bacterium]
MSMACVYRTTRGGMACLAAFLTLLSGTPHLDCLCADGHVKLFCLSLGLKSSPCCCAGSCCQAPKAKAPRASCCSHGRHARRSAAPGDQVSAPGCKKTLTLAKTATLPAGSTTGHQLTALPITPALVVVPVAPPAGVSSRLLSWQSYHQPPPTDLVIALQHLTI